MLWGACCLGFFGFLRAGEFTVNGTFDPTLHLTMADVQVDSSTDPQSFRVFVKCSKTDPFRKGCFIFLGRGSFPLFPVVSLTNYLHLCGPGTSPLFIYQNDTPLSRSQLGVSLWALASLAMSLPFLQAMPCLLGGPPAWRGGSCLGCLDLPAMGPVAI